MAVANRLVTEVALPEGPCVLLAMFPSDDQLFNKWSWRVVGLREIGGSVSDVLVDKVVALSIVVSGAPVIGKETFGVSVQPGASALVCRDENGP